MWSDGGPALEKLFATGLLGEDYICQPRDW